MNTRQEFRAELLDEGQLETLFKRIISEAEWGIRHAHPTNRPCNAKKALQVIIDLLKGEIPYD